MISAAEVLSRIPTAAPAPVLRALRRALTAEIAAEPPPDVLALALDLVPHSDAGRFLACELILFHPATSARLTLRDVEALGQGIDAWQNVDCFGCYIAGPAWRTGRIPDAAIHRWAHSPDRWWRRAALVSTVPLNLRARGGTGDAPRTLAVCELLLTDRDDMVVKALSWALRALAVRHPESVRHWLQKHQPVLAPRVLREVGNKLTTGLKNPKFRRR